MAAMSLLLWLAMLADAAPTDPAATNPAPPDATAPDSAVSAQVAADLVAQYEQADAELGDSHFAVALSKAQAVIDRLIAAGEPPGSAEARALLAKALALQARCRLNIAGKLEDTRDTLDRLLRLQPGFQFPDGTESRLRSYLDTRRRALIGTLSVQCSPFPCDQVEVNGVPMALPPSGDISVVAGELDVVAMRRNFAPQRVETIKLQAGQTAIAKATMEQVKRDLWLATDPAGATVTMDGHEIGKTEPADSGSASRKMLIESLPFGQHVIVVTAPCRRRVELSLDLFLDRQEPGPYAFKTIELQPARAWLEIKRAAGIGELLIDGKAAVGSPVEICPGSHQVDWILGDRRLYGVLVQAREGDTATLTLQPRPNLALVGMEMPPLLGEAWNIAKVPESVAAWANRALEGISAASGNGYPHRAKLDLSQRPAGDWLNQIDLILVRKDEPSAVPPGYSQVWIDPRLGFAESIFVRNEDPASAAAPEKQGSTPWPCEGPIDLVESVEGRSGETLVAVVAGGVAAPAPKIGDVGLNSPPTQLAVSVPYPWTISRQLLLPQIAFAEVRRVAGSEVERQAAPAHKGLALWALGATEEAAKALDAVAIDPSLDPFGDARGTVAFIHESIERGLNREHASEVHQRWKAFEAARLGGRSGPALRHAPESR